MILSKQKEYIKNNFLKTLHNIKKEFDCEADITKFIDNFPHIYQKLCDIYGTRECVKYLDGLMVKDRDFRQGFPSYAWVIIERIRKENKKAFPEIEKPDFTF